MEPDSTLDSVLKNFFPPASITVPASFRYMVPKVIATLMNNLSPQRSVTMDITVVVTFMSQCSQLSMKEFCSNRIIVSYSSNLRAVVLSKFHLIQREIEKHAKDTKCSVYKFDEARLYLNILYN